MTRQEAYNRAAALCARSEHCHRDIAAKLEAWEAPEADVIMQQLEAERYIDDARYARAFALDKLRYNQWGRIKIRAALRMKGVAADDIAAALAAIDPDEYQDVLGRVLAAKERQLRRTETDAWRLKQKLARHAASHGFETSLVFDSLDYLETD